MYTNIPHDLLIENIEFVLEEAFRIKGNSYFVKLNKKSATWAKSKPVKSSITYMDKAEIICMLKYLLDNIYIKYNGSIFRQLIGIPMGTDCAPDLANRFLFVFEYKYVMGLINSGSSDTKLFRFVYRYIDDLLILNDNGNFDQIFSDIYPNVLELKSTGLSTSHATYLDMDISIKPNDKTFNCTLFDKRNDFKFDVISLPNLKSNIPINQAYGTFYSQIIRMFRANNDAILFIENVKILLRKLRNQNFNYRVLLTYVNKFLKKYSFQLVSKFWHFMTLECFKL